MSQENDPTPTGAEQTEPAAWTDNRLAAEEQIAARVQQNLASEFQAFDEDTGEVVAKEDAPEPTVEADAPAIEAPPEPVLEAPRMVAIVVDGQTIEVEESRIWEAGKRTLQKDRAADKRLQEATQLKREAEEYAARVGLQRPSPDADPQPAPSQDAHQEQSATPFTPEALDTFLENKLYMRDAQKAATKFREDFKDIASDPYLMNMAVQLENQRLATVTALGESYGDPFDAYRKHGEEIRKWTAKLAGNKPEVSQDKLERKQTITAIPAANARPPAPKPDRPQTISEIIEEERKARMGRPITLRH